MLPIRAEDLLLYVWTQAKNIILNLIKWEVMLLAYDEKDVAAKRIMKISIFLLMFQKTGLGTGT